MVISVAMAGPLPAWQPPLSGLMSSQSISLSPRSSHQQRQSVTVGMPTRTHRLILSLAAASLATISTSTTAAPQSSPKVVYDQPSTSSSSSSSSSSPSSSRNSVNRPYFHIRHPPQVPTTYLLCDFESAANCWWQNLKPGHQPFKQYFQTPSPTSDSDTLPTTVLPPTTLRGRRPGDAISFYDISDRPVPTVIGLDGGETTLPPNAYSGDSWRGVFARRNNVSHGHRARKFEKVY